MVKLGFAIGLVTIVSTAAFVLMRDEKLERLIQFYEDFITSESQKALEYQLPEDASRYKADDDTVLDYGSYDFIVIGAGSAGSVIANRLSEEKHFNVLLIEAGTFPNNLTEIPSLYALGCFSDYNWGTKSVPQTTACLGAEEQRCMIPRGRGLGGTTLINGAMYGRGLRKDFDRWAELLNDSSWSYDNVLPLFKKSENFHHTDPYAPVDQKYHGTGGYWNVEHHHPPISLRHAFLEANAELGYNYTDNNAPERMGGTVVQYNTLNGRRHDQGTAFILPVIQRENLKVQLESYVTKIEVNNYTKEATGVLFTFQGQTYRAIAKKEVILSAGTIASPHILMLSGIGPQQHLEENGIPVIENLSVGMTLRDHVGLYGLQFTSNMSVPELTLRQGVEAYLNGSGPLTSNTQSHVIGWYQSRIETTPDYPDLELVTDVSSTGSRFGKKFLSWSDETWDSIWANSTSSFSITMLLLRTRSVGSVKLNSSNPFQYPLIDYNFLSDPDNKDIDSLYDAIQFCLELMNTTAFRKIGAKFEERPLPACSGFEYSSREYWYCYLRHLSGGVFHPVGTCSIGTDPNKGAVVDCNLKVFGVRNLRVADASVFPFTHINHPSADCAMIGEKVSEEIKRVYLQP